jgi:hypothetical protein
MPCQLCQRRENKNKKIPCFFAALCYSLIMKKKYYTSAEIMEYAEQVGAVCTFASVNLRIFKGWTAKGRYEVKFHRIEPCVWQKKIVKK